MLEYVAIFVMFSLAGIIAVAIIGFSHFLGQRTKNKVKLSPYECGTTTIGPTQRIMTIRYYIVAMLFLVFDIEIVFLYPWAVVFKEFKFFAFISMAVFIGILLIAYIYIWKKGALEWE